MSNLSHTAIVNILNTNYGFPIIDTPLGLGVKVSCKEGFIFSSITGAGYLENPIYPYSPKGQLKIFYNALQYKFVTGLFDNSSLRHTPYIISKSRPYLFLNNKTIIPVEFNSESELKEKLNACYGKLGENKDVILLRVETYKNGYGLESFIEYLACKYFNTMGYITENQIPLSYALGSPDFGGFAMKDTLKEINKFQITPGGFNIVELALIRIFKEKHDVFNYEYDEIVVGEAKTSTDQMETQLRKYLGSKYFDYGIEMHPFKNVINEDFGLLTLENSKVTYHRPNIKKSFASKKYQNSYKKWLEDYFKFYIISNYTNDELNLFFNTFFGRNLSNQEDIISLIQFFSISEHIELLLNLIEYGTFK